MTFRAAALALALVAIAPAIAQAQDPKTETREQKIDRLIRLLGYAEGENSYEVREKAQRELEAMGAAAIPALEKATKSDDLEVASRATDALSKIRKGPRRPAPKTTEPQDQIRGGGNLREQQERAMRDARKQLERQLPDGFRKMFQEFFKDAEPVPVPEGRDEERRGDPLRPRVRTWTWQLGPNGRLRRVGGQEEQGLEGHLGLRLGPASAALRAQLDIPRMDGRVINRITPGGWAATNGLELYDVVVAVDGVPVRRNADLEPLLNKGCKLELFRKSKRTVLDLPKAGATRQRKKAPPIRKQPKAGGKKQRSF